MSTRPELIQYLLTIDGDQVWAEDLLDAFATEAIHAAAEKLRTAWYDPSEGFGSHEADGVFGSVDYLLGITVAYGKPERPETTAP